MDGDRTRAGVDPAARDLAAAVRTLVGQAATDIPRSRPCASEAVAARYAQAAMEEMPTRHFPARVVAPDALAAALSTASPDAPPILSLTTELAA